MLHATSVRARAWGRALATLGILSLAALAQVPADAAHFGRGSRFSPVFTRGHGFGYRPGLRGSHFSVSLGGRNFRVRFGTSRYSGYAPYYRYPYYPPYYGGAYYTSPYFFSAPYVYTSPYLGLFRPSYPYVPRPTTVYVYPPPIVRTYPEEPSPPRERAELRERAEPRAESRRAPHPYDDPVSPAPERGSVDEALAHIRSAWLAEELEPLRPHLPAKGDIALYRDGELRQELTPDRFEQLTREAFRAIRTVRFYFTDVRRPAADEATATAVHTYVESGDEAREPRSVTLRYELVRRDDVWTLRAVRVQPED